MAYVYSGNRYSKLDPVNLENYYCRKVNVSDLKGMKVRNIGWTKEAWKEIIEWSGVITVQEKYHD